MPLDSKLIKKILNHIYIYIYGIPLMLLKTPQTILKKKKKKFLS
jgi:hypothetical protein